MTSSSIMLPFNMSLPFIYACQVDDPIQTFEKENWKLETSLFCNNISKFNKMYFSTFSFLSPKILFFSSVKRVQNILVHLA